MFKREDVEEIVKDAEAIICVSPNGVLVQGSERELTVLMIVSMAALIGSASDSEQIKETLKAAIENDELLKSITTDDPEEIAKMKAELKAAENTTLN